ncbi:MAG: M48 family metallopeptidase [Candidatus Micrarchaeia archaeon]
MASYFDEIKSNLVKSIILMAVFGLFFAFILFLFAFYIGGGWILFWIGMIALILYAIFTLRSGHKVILRISKAKKASREDYPELYEIVEGLSSAALLPMPQIYVIDDPNPNAFATGPSKKDSYICVTTGLLKMMDTRQLEGVLAHEMSHIYNNDIKFMMIAVLFAGAIGLIAAFFRNVIIFGSDDRRGGGLLLIAAIIFGILAPIFAALLKMAISRNREFMADANGARITRDPTGLIEALTKIKDYEENSHSMQQMQSANEITESLYFASPFRKGSWQNLFSTHPPIEERIARLQRMH